MSEKPITSQANPEPYTPDQIPHLVRLCGKIPVRTASRLDLLRECEKAGIKLSGTHEVANLATLDLKVEYVVPNLDLDTIYAFRDAGKPPWGGKKADQEVWGRGILTVQGTLQALLDYQRVHGYLPDPNRHWWLRCADPYVPWNSLCVDSHPGNGLSIFFSDDHHFHSSGGALPQEVPDLGT